MTEAERTYKTQKLRDIEDAMYGPIAAAGYTAGNVTYRKFEDLVKIRDMLRIDLGIAKPAARPRARRIVVSV